MYVFNKRKSDKVTCHIQEVRQDWKDGGKQLALVTYSGETLLGQILYYY